MPTGRGPVMCASEVRKFYAFPALLPAVFLASRVFKSQERGKQVEIKIPSSLLQVFFSRRHAWSTYKFYEPAVE